MDLKDLRYAVAVADEGSFTRAAARLNLAQQALSKQIRDLERELAVRLFVRLPRGARVTPVGAAFVEDARRTLAQSQRTMARARAAARGEAQRLRVGLVSCAIVADAAAAPLTCFRRQHAPVQIEVLDLPPVALLSALRDGTIDLGVASALPDDGAEVTGECVWERPFGAVLPAGHPIAAQDVVHWRDLVELPLIMFGRDSDPLVYDSLLRSLSQRGLPPRVADVRVGGPPGLVGAFVAEGEAWTLATADGSWPLYQRVPGIVFRRFADAPILAQRWMLWSRHAPSPLVPPFIATWKRLHGTQGENGLGSDSPAPRDADPLAPWPRGSPLVASDGGERLRSLGGGVMG